MTIDTSVVIFTVTAIAGIATWSLRQEGRINGHDALFVEREKAQTTEIEYIHASAVHRHEDTQKRLDRIERKLDQLPWMTTKA